MEATNHSHPIRVLQKSFWFHSIPHIKTYIQWIHVDSIPFSSVLFVSVKRVFKDTLWNRRLSNGYTSINSIPFPPIALQSIPSSSLVSKECPKTLFGTNIYPLDIRMYVYSYVRFIYVNSIPYHSIPFYSLPFYFLPFPSVLFVSVKRVSKDTLWNKHLSVGYTSIHLVKRHSLESADIHVHSVDSNECLFALCQFQRASFGAAVCPF